MWVLTRGNQGEDIPDRRAAGAEARKCDKVLGGLDLWGLCAGGLVEESQGSLEVTSCWQAIVYPVLILTSTKGRIHPHSQKNLPQGQIFIPDLDHQCLYILNDVWVKPETKYLALSPASATSLALSHHFCEPHFVYLQSREIITHARQCCYENEMKYVCKNIS
jgi:hypothetical protein